MNQKENKKGITLIALVVTIVVLVILASVSIVTIKQSGIINKTEKAASTYQEGAEDEEDKLSYLEKLLDMYGDVNSKFNFKVEQVNDKNPGKMEGAGTKEDPFVINSMEDLIAFSDEVNEGNHFLDDNGNAQYVQLGQTLDFNSNKSYAIEETKKLVLEEGFKPIGGSNYQEESGNSSVTIFSGNFDGNNYAILNMKINANNFAGLFGIVQNEKEESTYIQNITVTGLVNATLDSTDEDNIFSVGAGVVAACAGNVLIEQCNSAADVTSNAKNAGISASGGIVGLVMQSEQCNITKCINVGKVMSNKTIYGGSGGIVGLILMGQKVQINECQNTGYIENTGVYLNGAGGIIGADLCESIEVSQCSNSGNVYVSATYPEAGLVGAGGITGGSLSSYISIDNCSNAGNMKSKGKVAGGSGGIIGGAVMSEQIAIIKNCSNIGNSSNSSKQYSGAGGIVGGTMTEKENLQIENCSSVSQNVASGEVISGKGGIIGGIISESSEMVNNITVKNCYYNENQETIGFFDSNTTTVSELSYTMPLNKKYEEAINELNSNLQSGWVNWVASANEYPILLNSRRRMTDQNINNSTYNRPTRTETLDNLVINCIAESGKGLDKCFVIVKPSQYYDMPSTIMELAEYLTEEEKWQLIIELFNTARGTNAQSKEELFEALGVSSEEEFFEQLNIDSVDGIFELMSYYGVVSINDIMPAGFEETYNEKVNAVYKGISIVPDSSECKLEYSNNYGYTVYSVEKNGSYTFDVYNNGKKIATNNINIKNCLEWSNIYQETKIYTDSNGDTAIIPEGFRVTTTSEYNLVKSGLLVKDTYGNTFVWIPCSSVPAALTCNFNDFQDLNLLNPYPKDEETEEYLQMSSSVSKNGGFYVGRYETNVINGQAASVRTYSDNTLHGGTWKEAYDIQKALYNDNEIVKSAMMWGGQYSIIYNLTSVTANTRRIGATGLELSNEQFHMYDLYENLREVSQSILGCVKHQDENANEISETYVDSNYHVSYGACSAEGMTHYKDEQIRFTDESLNSCFGSRLTLYINN